MQVPRDNLSYHSLGPDGGLLRERQLLVEEQRRCRSRARRFSQETKRRRKVLEERRKQWDVQEQRHRENILQLRRERVQDATERFQRAHLPPSQRQRQTHGRVAVTVEDALSQINGLGSPMPRRVPTSHFNIFRSCTPSPRLPAVCKSFRQWPASAAEAHAGLPQEHGARAVTRREPLKTQDLQADCVTQDNHFLSGCCVSESLSESLSSKDSLDTTDSNPAAKTPPCSGSFIVVKSENPREDPGKPEEPERIAGEAHWGFASTDPPAKTETLSGLHSCSLIHLNEITSVGPQRREVKVPRNICGDAVRTSKAENKVPEPQGSEQETLLFLKPQMVFNEGQLKYSSVQGILLLDKSGKDKPLFEALHPPNFFCNDSASDNSSQDKSARQTGNENHYLPSRKELDAAVNNLNKATNSDLHTEESILAATGSNIESDGPERALPAPTGTTGSARHVTFVKGILKKESRCAAGVAARAYGSGHLFFAKQVALAIRDSIELTRIKAKGQRGESAVKKLRWFDEENGDKGQMKGRSSHPSRSKDSSEDHRLSLAAVSGASEPGPAVTPAASPGYHFTRQAWADVGVQVSLPQEGVAEVKAPRCSTRTAGPKVPQRELSAAVSGGLVSSRTRKGIVVRPQSATEVSQIARTQGKMLTPRPPARAESTQEKKPYAIRTPDGGGRAGVDRKQAPAADPDVYSSPLARRVIRADSAVVYTPPSLSCTCPVPAANVMSMPSLGHVAGQGCSRRRAPVHDGKGLCLDCTPTDDEISKLWRCVRSALTTKNAKTPSGRPGSEGGPAGRSPGTERSTRPPGSRNKRPPQPSQPRSADPERPNSDASEMPALVGGLKTMSRSHLVAAEGPPVERDIAAATETSCAGVQQRGATSISMEEQKILLSLDKLNYRLRYVHQHVWRNPCTHGLGLGDAPSKREAGAVDDHGRNASAAKDSTPHQKEP